MRQAIIFGLGSMFNHSSEQNVVWERDIDRLLVVYKANRDIQAGEELCTPLCPLAKLQLTIKRKVGISYGSRLWFKDVDAPKELYEGDGTDLLSNIHLE